MESSSDINKDVEKSLLDDYLAAYQEIKNSDDDNYLNNFRTLMALKYHVAKRKSDEVAIQLIDHALDEYTDLMDTKGPLCSANTEESEKINLQSGLTNIDDILQFVQPLPCQTDISKNCKTLVPCDHDIKIIMKHWNDDHEFSRRRKLPQSREANLVIRSNSNETHSLSSMPSTSTGITTNLFKRQEKRQQFNELYQKCTKFNKNQFDDVEDEEDLGKDERKMLSFNTAKQLNVQQTKNENKSKKTLGGKSNVNAQFVCPFKSKENKPQIKEESMDVEDERLKNIDPKMIELITNEIMDSGSLVTWDDVAGLEDAKRIIKEVIVFPMLRPDIFTGLRRPPKGMLLFGPPGTGKTLIGKCIASQSKSTFFSISASSLTSKWIGEGEKMVRALFAVARVHQPSVIFIDEIDSLLTQRSETEHESSRRIKTEFLVQLDGATTGDEDRILVIGATNRPQELDEAARRRFVKRLYVPLPEYEARKQIVQNLLANERHELNDHDISTIADKSLNYSGADMANLCKEASMGPIRSISFEQLENIRKEDVRCVTPRDFEDALLVVRPSVSQLDLVNYVQWDATYGSGTAVKKSN